MVNEILDSELICYKFDYLNYLSGRDTSGTRGGHNRENDSYDKNNGTGRRGGYQGKNSRSDNDREGDRKGGGRRGGFKSSSKTGNRDLNYEGGKASTSEDQTHEANSSSRINGQIAKNGPVSGNVEGKGAPSSGVEDSGLSSLSSSDCNKSGPTAVSADSKVVSRNQSYIRKLESPFLACSGYFFEPHFYSLY